MPVDIKPTDLVIHVLNVGAGDTIVVELGPDSHGVRKLGIIDCYNGVKTLDYVRKLKLLRPFTRVKFICATHPHLDHIQGIKALLTDPDTQPEQFWDSGFRHGLNDYRQIIELLPGIPTEMVRVSSGMEWYHGPVRITALAPSVALRNRFGTYGVDMNNASVVLRLELCGDDAVTVQSTRYITGEDPDVLQSRSNSAVAILAGDAEFDSWTYICQDYPHQDRESNETVISRKMVNLLDCSFLKVSHHASMHSAPLEVLERMSPALAVVSNKQDLGTKKVPDGKITRNLFPHPTTKHALEEVGATILTTDGSYETENGKDHAHPGTIVARLRRNGGPQYTKLNDAVDDMATPVASLPD